MGPARRRHPRCSGRDDGAEQITADSRDFSGIEDLPGVLEPKPACCTCVTDRSWTCVRWDDSPESCVAWGAGFNASAFYDPDCPEAWTLTHDDDIACLAACG